jgi:predicted Zn-dependent protease
VEHLARLYLANGYNAEAALLLPGIISRRPDDMTWVHRRADLLAGEGHLSEAVTLWQGIRAATKGHRPVRVKLAEALLKLNRAADAEVIYRELLAEQPDDPYAWYGLVRLDLQQGRWDYAREKLRQAVAMTPNFYGHHALLETVARHFGDTRGEAEADLQVKRLGRFREVPDAWTEAAIEDCYDPYRLRVDADRLRSDAEQGGGAGSLTMALARLDRAIALAPADAMNYQLLATIQGVAGNELAAQQAFEKGLEIAPRNATLYIRYSRMLSRQGKAHEARLLLSRGADHCPEDADIATLLGDSCAAAGQWPEAARMYRRVLTLRPELPDMGPKAAVAAFRAGDETTGISVLEENLRRHPHHAPTLGYLVMNAVRQGNAAQARKLLQRLKLIAPEEAPTQELQRVVQSRFGDSP